MLTVTIRTGNAAFEDNPGELPRLLRELADAIDYHGLGNGYKLALYDSNGNNVGRAEYWESNDEGYDE